LGNSQAFSFAAEQQATLTRVQLEEMSVTSGLDYRTEILKQAEDN
jgi:hypothetical protein